MERRQLSPEEIATQAGSRIPFLALPDRGEAFRGRAARLNALAESHPMGDYLRFIACVAETQQRLLDAMPSVALPSPQFVTTCNEHGMPPLNVQTHRRDAFWCDGLRRLLRDLADGTEGRQREAAVRLEQRRDDFYEAQASKLLAGITLGLDIATAPLVGAGLQVYFTHLCTTLGETSFVPTDAATLCPCCASRPTASIVRIGGDRSGYRFLHCSLCSAQWHMVRIKCANCESTRSIGYLNLEREGTAASKPAVVAEVCDECGSYLKLCSMERDPHVDPVADDLATLALDLLVTDAGKTPCGVNFMLVHGEAGDA
jgi:FdhE protein